MGVWSRGDLGHLRGLTDGAPLYGIAPGSPCYDDSHDPGLIHGANFVQAAFNSNAVMALSEAETNCLASQAAIAKQNSGLVTINPPGLPQNYDPVTGEALPGTALAPGTQTNTVNTDGPALACPWYCNIPGASYFDATYSTDCAGCTSGDPSLSIATVALLGIVAYLVVGVMLTTGDARRK